MIVMSKQVKSAHLSVLATRSRLPLFIFPVVYPLHYLQRNIALNSRSPRDFSATYAHTSMHMLAVDSSHIDFKLDSLMLLLRQRK